MSARALPLALLATSFACSMMGPAPPLFPPSRSVESIDFEDDSLNQAPSGLETSGSGRWAVVDSPTAVSGTQVVVRRGDDPAMLGVREAKGTASVVGEVSLRVLLGASGAGIACDTDGNGYVFKAEPANRRVALYRKSNGAAELLAAEGAAVEKGKWLRLGILCAEDRIVGYLDGKPVLTKQAPLGRTNLALYADPGVTAHFDDVRYAVPAGGSGDD
ncbi:MAG: hypothetical protein ACREQ9_20350 [Candidatus Binatia bacterium]